MRVLKAFFARGPLTVAVVAAGIAWLTGWVSVAVLGFLGAGGLAFRRAHSKRAKLLEVAAQLSGDAGAKAAQEVEALDAEIRRLIRTPGTQQPGLQARAQLDKVHSQLAAFREVLDGKFSETELTHGRFLQSAEQVYSTIIDNLGRVMEALRGGGDVDVDTVRAQIRRLQRLSEPNDTQRRECEALETRLQQREQVLAEAQALLATNEEALNHLIAATSSLAKVTTNEGLAALSADSAMMEIQEIAARAQQYAIEH